MLSWVAYNSRKENLLHYLLSNNHDWLQFMRAEPSTGYSMRHHLPNQPPHMVPVFAEQHQEKSVTEGSKRLTPQRDLHTKTQHKATAKSHYAREG